MTYPPPPAPGQPPPPPQPVRLRGRRPLQICIVLFVLAVAAFVVGGISTNNSLSKVNGFQRISITTDIPDDNAVKTVTFDKAGGYIAYYEGSDVDTDHILLPPVQVEILKTGATEPTKIATPYGHLKNGKVKVLTYEYNGHKGAALYEFHISDPGTYQAIALFPTPVAGSDIAFGKSIAKDTAIGAGIIVAGVLLLIAAIVLLIVGLVKRSRHKKQLAAGYAAPGYGPPGGYAPPGYAPPGGYPAPPGSYPPPGPVAQSFGTPPPQPGYTPPTFPSTYAPPPTGEPQDPNA